MVVLTTISIPPDRQTDMCFKK